MKKHLDIVFASSTLDAHAIARYIEMFAERTPGWMLPREQSVDYEEMCQKPSCCIVTANENLPRAAIHFTQKRVNSLYVPNIIPLDENKLSIDQYNAIVLEFARAIRKDAKKAKNKIVVNLSKDDIKLDDVVTGKISKRLLDSYLSHYPLSHHPSDLTRLYAFICSLFRYGRKPFDLEAFEYLLEEELGWSKSDAEWCRMTVETGLEVLAVDRNFN
jgi:hypothetical protein